MLYQTTNLREKAELSSIIKWYVILTNNIHKYTQWKITQLGAESVMLLCDPNIHRYYRYKITLWHFQNPEVQQWKQQCFVKLHRFLFFYFFILCSQGPKSQETVQVILVSHSSVIRIQAVSLFVAMEGKDIGIPTALKKVYVCLLQALGKIPIGHFLGSVLAKRLCIFQQSIRRMCLFHTNTIWVITR